MRVNAYASCEGITLGKEQYLQAVKLHSQRGGRKLTPICMHGRYESTDMANLDGTYEEPTQPTQAQPIVDTSVAEADEELAMQAWESEGGRVY